MRYRRARASTVPVALGLLCLLVALAPAVLLCSLDVHAGHVPHDPDDPVERTRSSDDFPKVNWKRWRNINPDVIGWITIPGTDIDFPILAASRDDPEYYLRHDVYKKWNLNGSIFLDAECDGELFSCYNSVLYGHHMSSGNMFAPVSNYTNESWAKQHRTVLVQTPTERWTCTFTCACIKNASHEANMINFSSEDLAEEWWHEEYAGSTVAVDNLHSGRILTLTTCSYHFWANERTVAHFSS